MDLPRNGWAGCILRPKTEYIEYARRQKEQLINGIEYNNMIAEIIKELTAWKDTSEANSKQVLMQAQRVETNRAQKEMLDNSRDTKVFHSVRRVRQKDGNTKQQKDDGNGKRIVQNFKYHGTGKSQRQ